jgi:hypothetical protein
MSDIASSLILQAPPGKYCFYKGQLKDVIDDIEGISPQDKAHIIQACQAYCIEQMQPFQVPETDYKV